jgi:hypothetical protein
LLGQIQSHQLLGIPGNRGPPQVNPRAPCLGKALANLVACGIGRHEKQLFLKTVLFADLGQMFDSLVHFKECRQYREQLTIAV